MNCKYCEIEGSDLIWKKISILGIEAHFQLEVDENHLCLGIVGDGEYHHIAKKQIRFCPMCGRELSPTNE